MKNSTAPLPWSEGVRDPDSDERARFIESHVDLVRYLALRIASRLPAGLDVDDLVHEGVLGLLDAVEKFDPARGVRFRTYAEARVRGAILDSLRQKDWRPRAVRSMQRDLDETIRALSTANGRAAGDEEIAAAMGLDLAAYQQLLRTTRFGSMLALGDLPPWREPQVTSPDQLPHEPLERRDLVAALGESVAELPERERRVLELYYVEGLNMKEVGAVLGVTESRVCQLHGQAAGRLRVRMRERMHVGAREEPSRKAVGRGSRQR